MKSIVDTIYDAQKGAYDIPQVTVIHGEFSIPEAYELQDKLVQKYLDGGSEIIGYKMGLTSRSKMEQMGVDAPIHGVLFKEMMIQGGKVIRETLIHPKGEPEVAAKFSKDVPIDADEAELISCIGWIAPAIDVIDSRYKDFKFTMADVVADNCSSAQFAIGEWVVYDPQIIDIAKISAELFVGGTKKAEGSSDAVLGSPITALMELHKSLAAKGRSIRAGEIVLTGAITAASSFNDGDEVLNRTDAIGEVSIR